VTHRLLGEAARLNKTKAALVSGKTGEGIARLLELIDSELVQDPVTRQRFRLPVSEGRALHLLHERAAVISQEYEEEFCNVLAETPESIKKRLSEFVVAL